MVRSSAFPLSLLRRSPRGFTFSWWGCCGLCQRHKPTELAHSFLFCSCVYFCFIDPFNWISFHKFSRQLSAFSPCSSFLNSALLVLSTIYLFMKVSLSPDIILCGWLGLKLQLAHTHTLSLSLYVCGCGCGCGEGGCMYVGGRAHECSSQSSKITFSYLHWAIDISITSSDSISCLHLTNTNRMQYSDTIYQATCRSHPTAISTRHNHANLITKPSRSSALHSDAQMPAHFCSIYRDGGWFLAEQNLTNDSDLLWLSGHGSAPRGNGKT